MRRLTRVLVASGAVILAGALAGCGLGSGAYDLPLPGGADLGSHPITISADFDDVVDLVPQSSVKVDNVAVGRVSKITLNPDGHSARVVLKVNGDVELPTGTTARLQQTSLLGEKYVALVRPPSGTQAGAPLASGARLGLADTSRSAEVEQVFGALSLVLNGGDIGQFQEISRELQQISDGRPGQIRAFLTQMNTFVSGLEQRKEAITGALDQLNALSKTLDRDKSKITTALEGLSPGMQVLVDQRPQFVTMLKALDRLSGVTVRTLNRSQKDIVADFDALAPVLDQLARAGQDLPQSLQIMLTYPFPDSVLGAIKGDYLNAFITTNFSTLPAGCEAMGCDWPQVEGRVATGKRSTWPQAGRTPDVPSFLPPTSSPMPGIPTPTVTVPRTPGPSGSSGASASPSASPGGGASGGSSPAATETGSPAGDTAGGPAADTAGPGDDAGSDTDDGAGTGAAGDTPASSEDGER